MPDPLPEKHLEAAAAAVAFAVQVRRYHRRRTGKDAKQRQADIARALRRIKVAMAPLRSEIGRLATGPSTERSREIREASLALQRERRKLWKMRARRVA